MYDQSNVFAKILRGEIPSYKLYEDDICYAFMDVFPVNPGHILIIPKKQVVSMAELDEETAGHLMKIGLRMSKALRKTNISCDGINFWISDGKAAGQEVFHVHLHIIPRFNNDGFGWMIGPNNRKSLDASEMENLATKIKEALC